MAYKITPERLAALSPAAKQLAQIALEEGIWVLVGAEETQSEGPGAKRRGAYKQHHRADNSLILALKPKILALLRERSPLTLGQLNTRLQAPRHPLWRALQDLRAEGAIEVERRQKNGGSGHYYLVSLRGAEA